MYFCDASQLHHHLLLPTMDLTRSYQGVAECSKSCRKARLKPEPGTTQKRQMQPKSQPMANKPAAIARKPRTARA